ncbi:MAG: fibronectin type III domain-containing protein, partial [Actinomycetes bacterium]
MQFRVTPTNFAGSGPPATISAPVPLQSIAGPPSKPSAPTLLSATRGDQQVTLSWALPVATGGLPVTGYKVEYSSTSATSGYTIANNNSATSPYVVTGLTNNVAYWFRVSAVSAAGTGSTSTVYTIPNGGAAAPSAFTYTATANAQSTLSWTAPTTSSTGGALGSLNGYRLEQSTDGGTTWTVLSPFTSSITSGIAVTPPVTGATIRYRVAAITGMGLGDWAFVSATGTSTLAGVLALSATPSSSGVTLSWGAPAGGPAVSGYKIERCTYTGTTCGAYAVLIASQAGLTYTDSTTTAGTVYAYKVTAISSANLASVLPVHAVWAPASPTGLVATAGSETVDLVWVAPVSTPSALGYRLEICSSACASGSAVWTVLRDYGTLLTASIDGLTNGTTYTVRVTSRGGAGLGAAVTTSFTPRGAPASPGTLTAVSGNRDVTLNWAAPSNNGGSPIIGYKIEYGTNSAFAGLNVVTSLADPTNTSFIVTGLNNATSYWFRVSAVSGVATSAGA